MPALPKDVLDDTVQIILNLNLGVHLFNALCDNTRSTCKTLTWRTEGDGRL